MLKCPCGLNNEYQNCCGSFIEDHHIPPTPEALMRSRYTAYAKANIDYIERTMKAPASNHFDAESARQWAKRVQWLGLKVIQTNVDCDKGYVEFVAYFNDQGKQERIHEVSTFHQINGQWFYVEGQHQTSSADVKIKIGRNDSCV